MRVRFVTYGPKATGLRHTARVAGATNDETLTWRGPLRTLPRELDTSSVRSLLKSAGWLCGMGMLAALPDLVGATEVDGVQRLVMTLTGVVFAGFSVGLLRLAKAAPDRLEAAVPPVMFTLFVTASVVINGVVIIAGPTFGVVAVFFVELLLMAFFVLRRPWAIAITLLTLALYAGALVALNDPTDPVSQFFDVVAAAVATGAVVGAFANRLDDARRELAHVNDRLEQRVADQVNELERIGRLRRFLSRQIAEVVTSEGADALLAPHRSTIAVFFVDLRGFTAFANAVSAERVMQLLDDYYDAVGSILDAHEATIGGFDGDGIFAYLGDPIARPDAAPAVVAMACEVARELDRCVTRWALGDIGVGYGIGLAYGEATLGTVGFQGRADYTPVGAVVNLAARLCADARHGEIVIDAAMQETAGLVDTAVSPRGDVDLKGFGITKSLVVAH